MSRENTAPLLYGRGDPLPLTMLVGLFQSFAIGYVTLGIVYYAADRFQADSATIGILASVYTATYVIACLALNKPISRLKPYHAVLGAVSLMALTTQLMIRVQSLAGLMILFLLYGVMTGFLWPPLMGWMSRGRDGKQLNRAMTAYNFSWSTAWMISPYVTGLFYERSPKLPFHMSGLFSLAVGVIVIAYLLIIPAVKESGKSEHHIKKNPTAGTDRSTPVRFLSWIGLFPGYFVMGLFGSVFPIFLRRAFSLPESEVGLVILVRAAVTLLCFYVMGKTVKWHFHRRGIILYTLLSAAALLVFGFARTLPHYILWTVLGGIIVGVTYTQSMFHSLSGALERQKRMNIHEIVLTAGMLAGSLLGGLFLDRFSMNFITFFAAGLTGLAFLVMIVVDRRTNP
ncbi:MAG: MFS transporter [Spirochaetales bacterium]|nr:MFS transporter [Spirochaetales bacterium]